MKLIIITNHLAYQHHHLCIWLHLAQVEQKIPQNWIFPFQKQMFPAIRTTIKSEIFRQLRYHVDIRRFSSTLTSGLCQDEAVTTKHMSEHRVRMNVTNVNSR